MAYGLCSYVKKNCNSATLYHSKQDLNYKLRQDVRNMFSLLLDESVSRLFYHDEQINVCFLVIVSSVAGDCGVLNMSVCTGHEWWKMVELNLTALYTVGWFYQ